jgi:hypothetical protein
MPPRTDAERDAWITRTLDPDHEIPPEQRTDQWVREALEASGFVVFTDLPWVPVTQDEVNRIAGEGWQAWWDAADVEERAEFDAGSSGATDLLFLPEELTELRQRGATPDLFAAALEHIAARHAAALEP